MNLLVVSAQPASEYGRLLHFLVRRSNVHPDLGSSDFEAGREQASVSRRLATSAATSLHRFDDFFTSSSIFDLLIDFAARSDFSASAELPGVVGTDVALTGELGPAPMSFARPIGPTSGSYRGLQ